MRDRGGRFAKGHPPTPGAGRPPGSPEGIKAVRALIGEVAEEMVQTGELREWLQYMRESGRSGVAWIYKNVLLDYLRRDVDIETPEPKSVTIRWGPSRE